MTAQFHDQVSIDGVAFALVAIGSAGLFDPRSHGLAPSAASTACWAGFVCEYAIRDGKLLLDRLLVNDRTKDVASAPQLNGRVASPPGPRTWKSMFAFEYADLGLPIRYSGGLLLASGFIRELYEHMGFHPAWKFERVLDVLVDDGSVVAVDDVSERMAEVRARVRTAKHASPAEVRGWIAETFARRYPS